MCPAKFQVIPIRGTLPHTQIPTHILCTHTQVHTYIMTNWSQNWCQLRDMVALITIWLAILTGDDSGWCCWVWCFHCGSDSTTSVRRLRVRACLQCRQSKLILNPADWHPYHGQVGWTDGNNAVSSSVVLIVFLYSFDISCSFTVLTLMVGWQEGHPASKNNSSQKFFFGSYVRDPA